MRAATCLLALWSLALVMVGSLDSTAFQGRGHLNHLARHPLSSFMDCPSVLCPCRAPNDFDALHKTQSTPHFCPHMRATAMMPLVMGTAIPGGAKTVTLTATTAETASGEAGAKARARARAGPQSQGAASSVPARLGEEGRQHCQVRRWVIPAFPLPLRAP